MGLFNVIKLANDYVKAKKLLKKANVDKIKVKEYIDKLHDYVQALNQTKDDINLHIIKVKEIMRGLSERLKNRKVGK